LKEEKESKKSMEKDEKVDVHKTRRMEVEFSIHHLAVSYRWHLTTANGCVRRLHGLMTTFVAITGK
jgi:hypothetical protein